MPLATDVEICGTDGVWRILNVVLAMPNRGKKRMRCVECGGHVRLHDTARGGSQAAHVEHITQWKGCPRSAVFEGGTTRPHPNRVPN